MSETSKGLAAALREMDKLGTQHVEVPEWPGEDGKPTIIYFRPLSTEQVTRYHGKKSKEANARVVCDHARDVDGNKLFAPGDYLALAKRGHYKTVIKIAQAILGVSDDEPETEEGEGDSPLD